jgi:hypothetical protein
MILLSILSFVILNITSGKFEIIKDLIFEIRL